MYGHKACNSLIRILKEAPELADLEVRPKKPDDVIPPKPWSKIKDGRARKLADRLLVELWFMGFAVSARKQTDQPPEGASRDPEIHKAWRNAKLPPPPKTTPETKDVEAEKPADAPFGAHPYG